MGILFQHLDIARDDHVRWAKSVGIVRGGGRPLGGQLIFTDRRVGFRPAQYERFFGATSWSIPLAMIDFLDIVPPESVPANLRSLFRIHLKDGNDHLFNFNGKRKALGVLGEMTGLTVKLDSPQELFASSVPLLSRQEVTIPVLTLGFLAGAIATGYWVAWVFVAIGAMTSLGYLRNRLMRRRVLRRHV
jgi:hypothetical protein